MVMVPRFRRSEVPRFGFSLVVALGGMVVTVAPAAQRPTPRVGVSLFSAFMSSSDASTSPSALTIISPAVRRAIESRLAARRAYRSQILTPSRADSPLEVLQIERGNLEGFLVALSGYAARSEAVSYARSAKLYYEWEGYADPPLDEADWAELYLRQHPRTALKPALDVFVLHRFRCAFEAALLEIDMGPPVMPRVTRDEWIRYQNAFRQRATEGYNTAWKRLMSAKDVVVRAVADDLDQQAYLYQNAGSQHPRRNR